MGDYCTWSADVLAQYARLVNRVATAAAAESAFVALAEAELDSRLGAYFTVPFSSDNLTAKALAIDLTYILAAGPDDPERVAAVQTRVDKAIGELIDGRRRMMTSNGAALASAGAQTVWSPSQGYVPIFGLDHPAEWEVDSSQLYDIAVDRGQL